MSFRLCAAALVLSLMAVGLVGCGGSSGVSTNTKSLNGDYTGTFAGSTNGIADSGTLSWTIDKSGTLTGTAHSNTTAADAAVTGTVSTTGVVAATFTYPAATYNISGTVNKASTGHLIGSLTESVGASAVGTILIDLGPR